MNISREDRPPENHIPENHIKDQPHRLRYLTLEQLGRSPSPEQGHRSASPVLLLPTEEGQRTDQEASAAGKIGELKKQLADLERKLPLAIERSRLEGEERGHGRAAAEFELALVQNRSAVGASLEAFRREREDYFRRVEGEVVKLALEIARKILHREAQMDSMLLSGIVRAALDRLEESTSAVLRVPVAEGDGWKNALANLPKPPTLVEDLRLRSGDCVLESQMGTIELGIGAQLEEISRGFFDLLREAPMRRGGDAGDAARADGRTPGAAS